ncbi:MAG: 3-dehydroquinate synthase [Ruminococcaceae bacterium]|jgi:3-dehydroquinate synthase|nr:3-dehydroquinate synthase [Oscillospiraceae bacterium]
MTLTMNLGERSYGIIVESGALSRAGELFRLDRRALLVTDSGVPGEYVKTVARNVKHPVILTIPEGEASKSMQTLEILLSAMLENGFDRHDCAVAVGGGVVGDLVGFAASLYMRGIDFYNIPTTLLSQVDSSIGGKTAVDFHGVKNVVGSFWQPKGVLIDPDTLGTLSPRHLSNGMAEALKMSLTSDAELFRLFEEEDPADKSALGEIIVRSLRIKKAVVEADEREAGLRKILNFGHTVGHAIESAAAPELYHGECVALGMLPMCAPAVRERLVPVLEKLNLPVSVSLPVSAVREAMLHDKKSAGGGIDAVTVEEPGSCRVVRMTPDELAERYASVFGGERT